MIKLQPVTKTIVVVDDFANPGFELGDKLYWDPNKVPLDQQPRPMVGTVVAFYPTGCGIDMWNDPRFPKGYFSFEYLANVSLIERDEHND